MRILVQLVLNASVTIDGEKVSSIDRGMLIFVGFTPGDDKALADRMIEKLLKLRVFPDENGKTNLSLAQIGGELLCVSQFTLYASLREGNRPSFVNAMPQTEAAPLYEYFYGALKAKVPTLQGGVFHADMKVALTNDGPFTVMLDSKELFSK